MENMNEKPEKFFSLNDVVEFLKSKNLDKNETIKQIQKIIYDHRNSLTETHSPKSIIESRLTPAEDAFEKGMTGCGSVANISAKILRELGFKVKLVHGECEESVDHAWISVLNENTGDWEQYDLTRNNHDVPNTHKVKLLVDSFQDIKEQIEDDHRTLGERQQSRNNTQ